MECINKYLMYVIAVFAILNPVSIAVGNVFLGLATAVFLSLAYVSSKSEKGFKQTIRDNIAEAKNEKYAGIFFIVIVIWMLTLLISALASGNLKIGLKTWLDLTVWRIMPLIAIYFGVQREEKNARIIFLAAAIGTMLCSSYAVYQGLHGQFRAPGFFGNPMSLAGYLCLSIPVTLVCFLDKKVFGKYSFVAGILFIIGFAALFYNGTRGAWLAVSFSSLLIVLIYAFKKEWKALVAIVLIGVSCAFLATFPQTAKRFTTRVSSITNMNSHRERVLIYTSAFKMFKDHPVLGVGLGQYKDKYQKEYISPKARQKHLTHAHNNLLQMLAENGIVGFVGFLTMFVTIILKSLWGFYKNSNPYALMMGMMSISLFLQGLTEYNFGNSFVVKTFWLLFACLLVLAMEYKKKDREK